MIINKKVNINLFKILFNVVIIIELFKILKLSSFFINDKTSELMKMFSKSIFDFLIRERKNINDDLNLFLIFNEIFVFSFRNEMI